MTQPEGGNDDVVKVVYQALADYSQLLRETRKAKAETAELKREIDGLAGNSTHRVKVTADTGQAQTELARVLRDVLVKVQVTVDAAAANEKLNRLLRDVTIKAKVALDAVAFRTELSKLSANTVKITVEPDVRRLPAQITAALRGASVKVAVELDRTGVATKLRALVTYLQGLGPVKLKVELDDSVLRDLDATVARLKRLRDELRRPGGGGGPPDGPAPRPPTPPRPTPSGGGGAAGAADAIPDGLKGAAGLITTFVPLAAAAVPIAGALAAGIGTIAGAFLAAGAAAGIFAVAAIGDIAKVTAAVQAYEKSGTLSKGPLGAVVTDFEQLKDRYGELEKATAAPVFQVFSTGLRIAVDLIGKVQPLITGVAGAIDDALTLVQNAFDGPGFADFLAFTQRQGPAAIVGFTRALLGLVGGAGRLIQAFEPFITAFIDGFARMGEQFDSFAAGLGTNNEFQAFLDYCVQQVPAVIDLVVNLIKAVSNIVVALAPVGSAVLAVVNGILAFTAALDPGTLRAIILVVLGVAVAIKAVSAAIALQAGIAKFQAFFAGLPGTFSRVGAAAKGLAGSLAGIGASLAIGAAVLALTYLMGLLADQQQEAADATKRHADAVAGLGQQLAGNGGDLNATEVRQQQYQALTGISAEGKAGGVLGFGQTKATVNLSDLAKQAGVSTADLVTGSLGVDPKVQSQNIGKFEAVRRDLLEQAKQPGADATGLKAQAEAIEKVITAYEAQSLKVGEAADAAKDYTSATTGATAATDKTATAAEAAADRMGKLKKALAVDFSSDTDTAAANTAISALDAYNDGLKAQSDAQAAATAATRTAQRAQEDLNQARKDAAQRLIDLQRALRDNVLDEKQAALNVKTSDAALAKAYANGDPDSIAQARIDNERAHNSLNDLRQDKRGKKDTIEAELRKGVDGNRALQDAITTNNDAQKALKTANANVGKAASKLTDLHLAFANAAGAIGLTEDQVKTLKTKMDGLKNKTLKIELNTKDAEGKLKSLLTGQYAIQLLARDPTLTLDQARKLAAAAAEAAVTAPKTSDTGNERLTPGGHRVGGAAQGGAMPGGPVAGPVRGAGTGTSDSIYTVLPVGGPVNLSNGEHIVTDAEVKAAGGHSAIEAFRSALRSGLGWAPARYAAAGGRLSPVPRNWAAALPTWRPAPGLASVPAYAGGGAVQASAAAGNVVDRSLTINGGIHVSNAVPEPASSSLYKQIRRATEGDDR